MITLSYPGKTSEIVEALARDAFIEALYDRDLALQVLAKEPNTLEKAYQTATKLQSYKELIYSSEPAKSSTYSVEKKSSAIQNESKVEGAVKQSKEEMKELTQVIQEMSRKMTQLNEEIEKMKKLSEMQSKINQQTIVGDGTSNNVKSYKKPVVCFQCN